MFIIIAIIFWKAGPARIFALPFAESCSSLIALLSHGEDDDLSMWLLSFLCHTQGSALLLFSLSWSSQSNFLPSILNTLCHVLVQWPRCFSVKLPIPTILAPLFFWSVCIFSRSLHLLISCPFLHHYVVLRLQWPQWLLCAAGTNLAAELSTTGVRQRAYGSHAAELWRWEAVQVARAAMGLLSLFLSVVAEHFPQSSLLTFIYSHLRKNEAFHVGKK